MAIPTRVPRPSRGKAALRIAPKQRGYGIVRRMLRLSNVSSTMLVLALVACGKSDEKPAAGSAAKPTAEGSAAVGSGSPAVGSGSGSAESEPAEAATVVGPVKSATGTIEVGGAMTGTFEWKKKDQRHPITCIWDPEKELGTLRIDVSDGANHLLTIGIDIPPSEAGPGRIEVSSKDLAAPLKSYAGFKMRGEDPEKFTATFESTEVVTDPDAQLAATSDKKKKAEPPTGTFLTLKGALEVTCPKKK